MKGIRILIILLFCSLVTTAQQPYSLQQCIETALRNNIRLKQAQLNLLSTKIDVKTSKAAMLPNLNASFSQNFNYGRNIDPVTNAYISNSSQSANVGVNSNVILFNGFQLLNNLKLAQLNFEATQTDVSAQQNDLSLQVAAAFLQVMYAEDNLSNAYSQLEVTQGQRSHTDILVKAGKLAESALYEQDAQQANDEYNVQMAQNGIITAKLTLLQLMELPATNNFKIERPNIALPLAEQYDVNVIYEQSLLNRPEVKGAQLRKDAARVTQKIAFGSLSPRFTLSGGLNTLYSNKYVMYNGSTFVGITPIGLTKTSLDTVFAPQYKSNFSSVPFNDQLNQNFGKYISLSLTVPIFNNLKVAGNLQKSKINLANQDLNFAQTKNILLKNIQQAITDVQAAIAKYTAAQKNLTAQSTYYANTELRYRQGVSSYLDFITSKNNKARAEINLQQAKYDLLLKSKIIDFYRGINITL